MSIASKPAVACLPLLGGRPKDATESTGYFKFGLLTEAESGVFAIDQRLS